jgi:cytochrome o ubiquinol oxidase subunit 3
MTVQAAATEFTDGSAQMTAADGAGPAPVRIVVAYGFWIFLLSDIIMFSALFATYAVLSSRTAGGPGPHELFELRNVAIETLCLLAVEERRMHYFYLAFGVTFALGSAFLGLEIAEFSRMIAAGAGPSRSAFLSAFFSLVGLHGVHITVGLIWIVFITAQVAVRGPLDFVLRRLRCFSLFWHALDIIWIALLSLVYLMGAR